MSVNTELQNYCEEKTCEYSINEKNGCRLFNGRGVKTCNRRKYYLLKHKPLGNRKKYFSLAAYGDKYPKKPKDTNIRLSSVKSLRNFPGFE